MWFFISKHSLVSILKSWCWLGLIIQKHVLTDNLPNQSLFEPSSFLPLTAISSHFAIQQIYEMLKTQVQLGHIMELCISVNDPGFHNRRGRTTCKAISKWLANRARRVSRKRSGNWGRRILKRQFKRELFEFPKIRWGPWENSDVLKNSCKKDTSYAHAVKVI